MVSDISLDNSFESICVNIPHPTDDTPACITKVQEYFGTVTFFDISCHEVPLSFHIISEEYSDDLGTKLECILEAPDDFEFTSSKLVPLTKTDEACFARKSQCPCKQAEMSRLYAK